MTGFSITDAALAGFRVVRGHPKAVLYWAAIILIATVAIVIALGPMLDLLMALPADGWKDPARLKAVIEPYAVRMDAVSLLSIPLNAVVNAAKNRALLRPEDDRFGYLRLGGAELRQLGLLLIMMGLGIAAATLVQLAAVLGAAAPGLAAILVLAALGLWIYVSLRLSLASALTFDAGRIDLVGAWRLSQGRVLPLFATYALAAALSGLVLVLTLAVTSSAVGVASLIDGTAGAASNALPSTLAGFLRPSQLTDFVLSALAFALVCPVWLAPPAAIYQRLRQSAEMR